MWHVITSFGDSALLLPLITWIAIALLLSPPQKRDARHWVVAAVGCGGIVALSKLLFLAWGVKPPGLDYTGFSGHTALSLLVWPSLGALLARRASRGARWVAVALGALLGAAVAVSRLALEVHSVSEVVMGALVGCTIAAWFIRGVFGSADVGRWRPAVLGLGAMVVAFVFYGRVFPSQHLLQDIALWISGHQHVFSRRLRLGLG